MKNNKTTTNTDFLLTSDVAQWLGVAGQTVILWERTGKLPAIRVGSRGTRLFRRDDVERLKDKRQHRGKTP